MKKLPLILLSLTLFVGCATSPDEPGPTSQPTTQQVDRFDPDVAVDTGFDVAEVIAGVTGGAALIAILKLGRPLAHAVVALFRKRPAPPKP